MWIIVPFEIRNVLKKCAIKIKKLENWQMANVVIGFLTYNQQLSYI